MTPPPKNGIILVNDRGIEMIKWILKKCVRWEARKLRKRMVRKIELMTPQEKRELLKVLQEIK